MFNDRLNIGVIGAGGIASADDVIAKISDAIRDVTKLRGSVEWLAPGSLPNDGRVIEDARSYK